MSKIRKIIITVLVLAVVGGGGAFAYTLYNDAHYLSTDNAQITAKMITITPIMAGKLKSWNVGVGDPVAKDQVMGQEGNLYIRSPLDGEVVRSNVVPDQTVAPGMELAVVADTANTYMKANIEETNIAKIAPGQMVDIKIDAYPGRVFTGYVRDVELASQQAFSKAGSFNTSGTFTKVTQLIPVNIDVVNEENLPLRLGMNASIKVHLR